MEKTTLSKNKNGYGYKYTDLAQIHEYLESINASYIQITKRIENDDYVMTKRCFDGVWEEEWLQGAKIVDAVLNGIKNPAQEQGSALTYARRYSLLMAFGLATEDDDAASLTVENPIKKEYTSKQEKIKSLATKDQIKRIKSLYNEEEQKKALEIVKKSKIEDLTVLEASQLISKRGEK